LALIFFVVLFIVLKEVKTEFKLYTRGQNLKRIYNEINNKNN